MKLEQLRLVVEIARNDCNISRAAYALGAAQPAVSRQLKALERELGVDVFVRGQKRLRGLTQPGAEILDIAQRVIADVASIGRIAADFSDSKRGLLRIATTHTQARYALPPLVRHFAERYPQVQVTVRQASPGEALELVRTGAADLCIGSEAAEGADLLTFPCYAMQRVVLTPVGHPLLKLKRVTLEKLARFPIITYDAPALGRSKLEATFAAHGLAPRIVLSAIDTDVIKAYVEQGLGIAIVASLAFDRARDRNLRAMDASHLFQPNTIHLGIRRNDYLRGYALDFIEMFAPQLTRKRVQSRLREARR